MVKKSIKTYENGIKYIHFYIPYLNSIMATYLIKVGSAYEYTKKEFGIAHYLEHLLFKGSEKFPDKEERRKKLQKLQYYENAWTYLSETSYFSVGPLCNFSASLEILTDKVYHPLLRSEDVETERDVILEELNMNLNEPSYLLNIKMYEKFMGGSTYEHPTIGTKKSIENMSTSRLKKYHHTYYSSRNSIFITYGGVKFSEIEPQVAQEMKNIHQVKLPDSEELNQKRKGNEKSANTDKIELNLEIDTPLFSVFYRMPVIEKFKDYLGIIFLVNFIFGGRSSLISKKLVYDENLISDYDFEFYPAQDYLFLFFNASVEYDKLDQFKKSYYSLIDSSKDKFTKRYFERTKGYLLGSLRRSLGKFNARYFPIFEDLFELLLVDIQYNIDLTPEQLVIGIENLTYEEVLEIWDDLYWNKRSVEGVIV